MIEQPRLSSFILAVVSLAFILLASGCALPFTRTVYVPPGTACQLRKPIKNAPVWEKDKDGKKVATERNLAEGWMVLPVPPVAPGDLRE
ncbi:MAG TPA: hypothetical protein VLI39_07610 [Sedimentisphaerales bacterium]|nr:hypothetical protein [Sedimentisphaerales bacterium]